MEKRLEPFTYDIVSTGFSCPECGRPQVKDNVNGLLWCINGKCEAFAMMFESNYKEQ